jgi:CrcB protein
VEWLWVGTGGFVGANARYWLGRLIVAWLDASFPWHTLAINVSGGLGIGALATLLAGRVEEPAWRLALIVGFLGGYTTFSSYTLELLELVQGGRAGAALVYALASNAASLAACVAGVVLARGLTGR